MKTPKLKINDFIRKNSGRDQKELYNLVEKLMPVKASLSTGVVIKPHALDRVKFKHRAISVSTSSIYNMNLDINAEITKSGAHFLPYNSNIDVNTDYIQKSFSLLTPYETNYNIHDSIEKKADYFISLASNSLNVIKDCEEKNILKKLTSFSIERSF